MKTEIIQSLNNNFESFANKTEEGIEFWFARDLQKLLGYEKWNNFLGVIEKAKISCNNSNNLASDHFADVGKTIQMPKGAEREVLDMMLFPSTTRPFTAKPANAFSRPLVRRCSGAAGVSSTSS